MFTFYAFTGAQFEIGAIDGGETGRFTRKLPAQPVGLVIVAGKARSMIPSWYLRYARFFLLA